LRIKEQEARLTLHEHDDDDDDDEIELKPQILANTWHCWKHHIDQPSCQLGFPFSDFFLFQYKGMI
jgi:hypothetical protein